MSKIYRNQVMFYLHIFYYFLDFVHMYFKLLPRISIALNFHCFSQNLVNAKQNMANSLFGSQLVQR